MSASVESANECRVNSLDLNIARKAATRNKLREMWNSNFTDFTTATTSGSNLNKTRSVTQVLFACGTGAFYLVVVALSICGVCVPNCARLSSSRGTLFVFFVGVLLASTNVFTYSHNMDVKLYFRCSVVLIVGIAYILFGAARFFKLREQGSNEHVLAEKQPFMGAVVGVVTFPLFALELVFLIFAVKQWLPGSNGEADIQRGILIVVYKTFFLFQKPVQLAIYLWLRRTIPHEELNAKFYFRIISFFNLIEWLDAQVNVDADLLLSGIHYKSYRGHNLTVETVVYKALIIDYRLLCCLLFLEHSLEIEDNQNQDGDGDPGNNGNMTDRDELRRCCGCFAGTTCLLAPLLCGLYFANVSIKASVQLSAMIVQIAIVISGVLFLRMNNLEAGEEEHMYEESTAVKIMVCCFGAVGFLSWIMHAAIAGYWAVTEYRHDITDQSYTTWDSVKFGVRGLSTAFMMYLFTKVNAQALPPQNPDVTCNLLAVPVIMFGILSTFIETLVDQHVGAVDSTIRRKTKEQIVKILLEAGLPMYLGFLIHVFLHFFIIETKLPRCLGRNRRGSYAEYYDAVEEL